MSLNRIQPQGSPDAYKTYQILMPPETHTRPATCEEVDCPTQASGWLTSIDERTGVITNPGPLSDQEFFELYTASRPLAEYQAFYIRYLSGRVYNEAKDETGFTLFTFPSGEECFEVHTISLDRDASYVIRGGDWRGNPRKEVYVHDRPDNWVEDFAEHQDRLAKSQ